MSRTKVTSKFQLTIPKEIREQIDLKAGEVVEVQILGEEGIAIKRFRKVKSPLKVLVGETPSRRHVSIEEFEEYTELR
jgi:AbrB family looped-hinge helix DNA binding protein